MESHVLQSPEIKYIHFVGIGGISMSGLAAILLKLGYRISGSDIKLSKLTEKLEAMGVEIFSGHSPDNVKNPDLVIYTAATSENNPERVRAKELGIPVIERAVLLGEITKMYPRSIAVAGTHGKTTTTSMIAMIMLESGLDPTVHIGGELNAIGGTVRTGGNRYFITEACEYVESFLKFHPYMAVILNIELDHVDYYKNIDQIKEAFRKFALLVPEDGYVIACVDDPNTAEILKSIDRKRITFGISSENASWKAADIAFDNTGCATFTLMKDGKRLSDITLGVPGIHNVSNALAAIASCHTLGCGIDPIRDGLRKFRGAGRRFEIKGDAYGIRIIDDYAHHPSEISATLKAAGRYPHRKIWCIFQPHTYTRTKSLLDDFSTAFTDADAVVVADIYAAREPDNGEIHSSMLVEKINAIDQKALYIPDFKHIVEYLAKNASSGDVIITMGAGDIYKVGEMFLTCYRPFSH